MWCEAGIMAESVPLNFHCGTLHTQIGFSTHQPDNIRHCCTGSSCDHPWNAVQARVPECGSMSFTGTPKPCICMGTLSKVGCNVTRCLSMEMRSMKTHVMLPLLSGLFTQAEAGVSLDYSVPSQVGDEECKFLVLCCLSYPKVAILSNCPFLVLSPIDIQTCCRTDKFHIPNPSALAVHLS